MNPDDFYFHVFLKFVKQFKEYRDAARELNVSPSLMSKMVSGVTPIGPAVAEQLGYKIEKVYVHKVERP